MFRIGSDYWDFWIGEAKGWTWGSVEEGTLSWDLCERFYFLVGFFWFWYLKDVSFDIFSMFLDEQVNISLNAAVSRLKQTREEKDQFHEANNQMVFSLQAKVPILFWLPISDFQFWICCTIKFQFLHYQVSVLKLLYYQVSALNLLYYDYPVSVLNLLFWWDSCLLFVSNKLLSWCFFCTSIRRMNFQNLLTHVTRRPV